MESLSHFCGLTGIGGSDRNLCQYAQSESESRVSDRTGSYHGRSHGRSADGSRRCLFCKSRQDIGKKYGVSMPIVEEINKVLFEGKSAKEAVEDLMLRDPRIENSAFPWEA